MSEIPASLEPLPVSARPYDQSFARWVARNIKGGDALALCMQCGVCSGSCRTAKRYDHGPRLVFQMIRAGYVHRVMTSSTVHGCGLCFLCVVRCPRKVPVAHILRDLARKAGMLGYSLVRAAETAPDPSLTEETCPICARSAVEGPYN